MVKYDMQSGEIKSSEVKKNRDGENSVRVLTVEISDPDDLQSVEHMTQAGEDTHPPAGSKVVILSIGSSWKIAIACDDGIEPEVEEGEKKIYSSDGGAIKAFIHFKKNGDIVINDDADNAVRYSKLEEAFNQLKDDFSNFVTMTYNLHMHPTAAPGAASPPTVTGTSSTADITPAKIDEIQVP
jgi:phage gp45-like